MHIDSATLIHMLPTAALVHDADGRVCEANARAERLLCLLDADWRGRSLRDLWVLSAASASWSGYMERLAAEGVTEQSRFALVDAEITARVVARAVELDGGERGGLVVLHDIQRHPLKGAELASASHDAGVSAERRVLEGIGTAYYRLSAVYDDDGEVCDFRFEDMNPAAVAEVGMPARQVLGRGLREMFPIMEEGGYYAQYKAAFESGRGFEQEFHIPSSEPVSGWFRHEVVPLEDGVAFFNRNISQMKLAKESLRQALETLPDPIFVVNSAGVIQRVNAAVLKVFGYTEEELVGAPLTKLMPSKHASRHDQYIQHYVRTRRAKIIGAPLELTAVDKDGEEFPVRLAVGAMEVGDDLSFVGSLYDLRPVRRLEAQLRQKQKMEALGLLAGGVAHDFNNLLTVIIQNATLLEDEGEGELVEFAEDIIDAGERAASLISQLMLFSRREVGRPERLDLVAAVGRFSKMLRRLLPESHALSVELPPDALCVTIDPSQFEQLLLNLIVNARDAMPEGGRIALALEGVRGAARLTVQDEGVGIAAEVQPRIFEPFFTTKERGRGTGLGLATVFGVVNSAGGSIRVNSAPERGATFVVTLPLSTEGEAAPVTTQRPGRERQATRANRVVVFVEDDPMLRSSVSRWLERGGYQVHTFATGEEALARLERIEPEVLLTDVVMPGMNGVQLAEAAKRARPDLAIVFTSGHPEGLLSPDVLSHAHYLPKPFAPQALFRTLEEALGGS